MVAKVAARSLSAEIHNTGGTRRVQKNNDDNTVFEFSSKSSKTDTYQTSSNNKSADDDGKISTGSFFSEYFSGMWGNIKQQGKKLVSTFKQHPVLSTIAIGGTVAAAAYFPIVAGVLGGISLITGGIELAKDVKNGIDAYSNYKNSSTDDDAKKYARDIGASSLNSLEDITMIFLGLKAFIKPANDWYIMKLEKLFSKKRFTRADFIKPHNEPDLFMKENLGLKEIKNAVIQHYDDGIQATVITGKFNNCLNEKCKNDS